MSYKRCYNQTGFIFMRFKCVLLHSNEIEFCKGGTIMKKPAYFIIQVLWSFILATIIWFGFISTASVDGDNTIAEVIIIGGSIFYLLLTIAYVVLGAKKVEGFGVGMGIVSVLINIITPVLGFFCALSLSSLVFNATAAAAIAI